VVTITGSGFDSLSPVTIEIYLSGQSTPTYSLPGTSTDNQGNFVVNATLPAVTGNQSPFILIMATTANVTGSTPYLLPYEGQIPGGTGQKTFKASPDNSNIFNVTGTGFGASKLVTLTLTLSSGLIAYTFPDQIKTDDGGRFSTIAIVPTTISGAFNLTASAAGSSDKRITPVTIPNLKGATGQTGPTGAQGTAGEKGDTGAPGLDGAASAPSDQTMVYVALALSAVALAVSVIPFIKKRS
jgi:hypothetical protein